MSETLLPIPTSRWAGPSHDISVFNPQATVVQLTSIALGATDRAWPTANLAIYVPVRIIRPTLIRKFWNAQGATGTGNFDMGIYTAAGSRVVATGTTAKVAAVAEKIVDVTDTGIVPGLYYLAMVDDTNTDTYLAIISTTAAPIPAAMGVLTEALASASLPSTATWVVNQTLTYVPQFGISLGTVL